jgi:hypothetical protein
MFHKDQDRNIIERSICCNAIPVDDILCFSISSVTHGGELNVFYFN